MADTTPVIDSVRRAACSAGRNVHGFPLSTAIGGFQIPRRGPIGGRWGRALILAIGEAGFMGMAAGRAGFGPPSIVVTFLLGLVALFPLNMLFLGATAWARSGGWRYHPIPVPSPDPLGGTAFQWSGRPWARVASALAGMAGIPAIVLLPLLWRPGPGFDTFTLVLLAAALVLGAAMVLLGLKRRSVTIDGQGVRTTGRLRRDFDVPWGGVARVDVVEPPDPLLPGGPGFFRIITLGGHDGSALASILPRHEVGPRLGQAFEAALRAEAQRRRIPVQVITTWAGVRHLRRARHSGR